MTINFFLDKPVSRGDLNGIAERMRSLAAQPEVTEISLRMLDSDFPKWEKEYVMKIK